MNERQERLRERMRVAKRRHDLIKRRDDHEHSLVIRRNEIRERVESLLINAMRINDLYCLSERRFKINSLINDVDLRLDSIRDQIEKIESERLQ